MKRSTRSLPNSVQPATIAHRSGGRIDETPSRLKPAPLLGADTADILCGELGLSETDLEALRDRKVI